MKLRMGKYIQPIVFGGERISRGSSAVLALWIGIDPAWMVLRIAKDRLAV
jgi:hypothetical protein